MSHPSSNLGNMKIDEQITYTRIPYWQHNTHTATCTERVDLADGTADCVLTCSCGATWAVAVGVPDSEVPDEG